MPFGALSVVLVLAAGVPGKSDAPPAPPPIDLDLEHDLSSRLDTPHTAWARPYGPGPIRVLFVSRAEGTTAREAVELAARFEVTIDAVFRTADPDRGSEDWLGGEAGIARLRRLLRLAYDAYVFHGVSPDLLPSDLAELVRYRVRSGAGLVLVGAEAARTGVRLAPAPGAPAADLLALGGGRVASLGAPPEIPYAFGWEIGYDHWQERLGRAVLWAAGKLGEPAMTVELAAGEIDRDRLPGPVGRIAGAPAAANLEARVRRDGGDFAGLAVPADAGGVVLAPVLAAGRYHLDAWARSAKGVEAWATAPFEVTSRRRVTLALRRSWGEAGGSIAGEAAVAGDPPGGGTLRVELRDRHGRVLARRPAAAGAGRMRFRFRVDDTLPMRVEVRAVLADRPAAEVAEAIAPFQVTRRQRGRFHLLAWDVPRGPAAFIAEAALARAGVTLHLAAGAPPAVAAAHDIGWVAYAARILAGGDAAGATLPVAWNQEPEVGRWVAAVVAAQAPARRHGVFAYSLGDETATQGADRSPSDLAAYRAYLRRSYRRVGRLNAAWGTTFRRFAEVDVRDPEPAAAGGFSGEVARWYDRQAWAGANFAALLRRFGGAFRGLDPQARVGIEGSGALERGDDYDAIVAATGFWTPYAGPGDPLLRSIAPPGYSQSRWIGYDRDGDALAAAAWRAVLEGADGLWWWRWDSVGRFHGLLRPTLDPYPAAADLLAETRVLREGLGDLLLRYRRVDDGVAVLYSPSSFVAAEIDPEAGPGSYLRAHEAAQDALARRGLAYRYVTRAILGRERLRLPRTRLLVLPHALALGGAEARAIRRFAAAGGRVVSDLPAGIYDDHLVRRQPAAPVVPATAGGLGAMDAIDPAPAVSVRRSDGLPLDPIRVGRWRDGEDELVGLQTPAASGVTELVLAIAAPRRVIDLKAGRDLGERATWTVRIAGGRAAFFALLTSAPPPLRLAIRPRAPRRGADLTVRLSVPGASGARAVRLAGFRPDGSEAEWVRRVVVVPAGGSARVRLRVAHDDPAGTWRIEARELFAGETVPAALAVAEER